jgi:hypothetical protein
MGYSPRSQFGLQWEYCYIWERVQELREEQIMANEYNLFISHSWTYGDSYDRLVSLLNERGYFPFKDYSVPKSSPIHNAPNEAALYAAIKERMSHASVVIILAGVYVNYSKWINKEISIAKKEFVLPKPILAIRPFGSINISTAAQEHADEIVAWNTESVVAAIRRLAR